MLSLVDKAMVGVCVLLSLLLALSLALLGTEIAHQRATISGLKADIARVSAEKTAAQTAGLACTASVEALHQAALAADARLAAAEASAARALTVSKPLPPTPAGCSAAASWALTQAPDLASTWGFPK